MNQLNLPNELLEMIVSYLNNSNQLMIRTTNKDIFNSIHSSCKRKLKEQFCIDVQEENISKYYFKYSREKEILHDKVIFHMLFREIRDDAVKFINTEQNKIILENHLKQLSTNLRHGFTNTSILTFHTEDTDELIDISTVKLNKKYFELSTCFNKTFKKIFCESSFINQDLLLNFTLCIFNNEQIKVLAEKLFKLFKIQDSEKLMDLFKSSDELVCYWMAIHFLQENHNNAESLKNRLSRFELNFKEIGELEKALLEEKQESIMFIYMITTIMQENLNNLCRQLLDKYPLLINYDFTEQLNYSLLHHAIVACNVDMVKLLVEKEVSLNKNTGIVIINGEGPIGIITEAPIITPLFNAICALEGCVEQGKDKSIEKLGNIITFLLENGACIDAPCRVEEIDCGSEERETPLSRAKFGIKMIDKYYQNKSGSTQIKKILQSVINHAKTVSNELNAIDYQI